MKSEIVTGTTLVRQALRNRNRKLNMAGFAKDLGMTSDRLDAFEQGRVALDPETIQALVVKVLFNGHVEFDSGHDALTLQIITGGLNRHWSAADRSGDAADVQRRSAAGADGIRIAEAKQKRAG
jgi:hypothetical protein